MIMRYELIVAGLLLLACALSLKIVWDLRVLPRLALSLNLLLATLAAFHFWPFFHGWTSGLALAWDAFPVDAGAFWAGLMAAALPGWVVCRYTFRHDQVEFPTFFDRLSGVVCMAAMLWLVPCLLVMTVSVVPATARNVLPEEGVAGQWTAAMRQAPLRFYLRVAETAGGERSEDLLSDRIPVALRQQVFPRRSPR